MNDSKLKQTLDFVSKQALEIQFYTDKINEAETRLQQARDEIETFLASNYPLNYLIGKAVYRYRPVWGTYHHDNLISVFTEEQSVYYANTTPHGVFNGEQVNYMLDTDKFDKTKYYLIYVESEHELYCGIKKRNLKPIYEYLIFEI